MTNNETSLPDIPSLHADILYKLFTFFSYDELLTSIIRVCQLWRHIGIKRMRQLCTESEHFMIDDDVPYEPNSRGRYPFIMWGHYGVLWKWEKILRGWKFYDYDLPIPSLLVHDMLPIIIYLERNIFDQFEFCAKFHPKLPNWVPPVTFQLEVKFMFMKKGKVDSWMVERQIIATVGTGWPLFKVYDVPLRSLSKGVGPQVHGITIKKISPEQKWFYWGLAPLASVSDRPGRYETIDCNSLKGSHDCAREWDLMVTSSWDQLSYLTLPPLILPRLFVLGDAALCVYCLRYSRYLQVFAKLHPFTLGNVKSRELFFKMDFRVTKVDNSDYQLCTKVPFTLKRSFDQVASISMPWSEFAPSALPRITLSILPINDGPSYVVTYNRTKRAHS